MSDEKLADLLRLTDWRDAMLGVSREVFVPLTGMACPEGGAPYSIDRKARPDEWRRAVYSDASIITQRDDGDGDPLDISTGLASSSISAPGIAFEFLSLLEPRRRRTVGSARGRERDQHRGRPGRGRAGGDESEGRRPRTPPRRRRRG